MASKNKSQSHVEGATLNSSDGYTEVSRLEGDRVKALLQVDEAHIVRYDVYPHEKFWDVTVVVFLRGMDNPGSAAWKAYMLVKAMHPSIYKESKIAHPHEDGWMAYVNWKIWNAFQRQD